MTAATSLSVAQDAFDAGQFNRALELAEASIAQSIDKTDVGTTLSARVIGIESLLELRRPLEALSWIDEAVRAASTAEPDEVAGQAGLAALEVRAALAAGATNRAVSAVAGLSGDDAAANMLRAEVAYAAGEWEQARDHALAALHADRELPGVWAFASILGGVEKVDVTPFVDELVRLQDVTEALGNLVGAEVAGAHRLLEALWQRPGCQGRALAAISFVGPALPLTEALEWSARMRAFGLDDECPLLGSAANTERPPAERVRAAAAAHRAFGDIRALPLLTLAATALRADELAEAFDEVMEIAPDLVEEFVTAAAGDGRRCVVLAGCLERLGVGEFGLALLRHALDAGMSPQAFARTAGTLPVGERDGLLARARRDGDERLLRTLTF